MTSKAKVTIWNYNGTKLDEFYSKTLTKVLNSLQQGSTVKFSIQENNFGDQFVGDYVVKALPNEQPEPIPPEPTPIPPEPTPIPPEPEPQPPEPEPIPPEPTEGLLWSSNRDGKWSDGKKRTITTKQGGQKPDDKSIFVAASGSPELIVDGDGVAHLHAGSGGVDNLSLKLRCRHREGGECANRAGGEGLGLARTGWDIKRETCHNIHDGVGNGKISKAIADNQWYSVKFSCKDEGANKIRLIAQVKYDKAWVDIANVLDSNAEAYFFDKTLLNKNSYFWIRINNSAHGRIYIMALNYNSELTLDFMFEPAKSSVALRNVELVAI